MGSNSSSRGQLGDLQGSLRKVNKYSCNYLPTDAALADKKTLSAQRADIKRHVDVLYLFIRQALCEVSFGFHPLSAVANVKFDETPETWARDPCTPLATELLSKEEIKFYSQYSAAIRVSAAASRLSKKCHELSAKLVEYGDYESGIDDAIAGATGAYAQCDLICNGNPLPFQYVHSLNILFSCYMLLTPVYLVAQSVSPIYGMICTGLIIVCLSCMNATARNMVIPFGWTPDNWDLETFGIGVSNQGKRVLDVQLLGGSDQKSVGVMSGDM
jgi:hypothetical protein